MENTVNSRVLVLKKELGLTDVEFCGRASISTSTLNKIKNEGELTQKIVLSIQNAFNVNKEWLLNGKGKMFADAQKETTATNVDPWKDALVSQVKEENNRLQKEVERLWQMVSHFTGGAKPNFHKATDVANMLLFPNKSRKGLGAAA